MPVSISGTGPITGLGPLSQCTLQLYSGSAYLFAYNGNQLYIGGRNQTIPAAGVALSPTGLTVGTTYWVYAFMNGSTMTLEASTTGHTWDGNTGFELKTGDSSRTLVGMVRPITGPAFVDSFQQRFVVSWFNRRMLPLRGAFTTDRTTGTSLANYSELGPEIRIEFLSWYDAMPMFFTWGGNVTANGSTSNTLVGLAIDGNVDGNVKRYIQLFGATSGWSNPVMGTHNVFSFTEGYHYATVLIRPAGSSSTFYGDASPDTRAFLLQSTLLA